MNSEDSTPSIEARVMRISGAITNRPSVSEGSASCLALAQNDSRSRASRLSTRNKPVIAGGGENETSMRPSGAGAMPSRK